MSIQILSRIQTDFGLGLTLATSFPVLMNSSTFSVGISSDVSVTYLLIIHKANPWNCSIFKQWFGHDITAITSFVRIEFHIRDWADLCIWTNPPSRSGCCEVSRLSVFSTCCLHILRSFLNFDGDLSFLNLLQETSKHLCKVSTISALQEVVRISVRILATSHPVPMMLSSEMWCYHGHSQSVPPKFHRSHFQHNLNLIRCANLRLLRWYWADWLK